MSVSSTDATDSDALLGPASGTCLPRVHLSSSNTTSSTSPATPIQHPAKSRHVRSPAAIDLIELASSAEDVSLCGSSGTGSGTSSTASDYKSCHDDVPTSASAIVLDQRHGGNHQHERHMLEPDDFDDDDCCLPDEPLVLGAGLSGGGGRMLVLHSSASAAQLSVSSSMGSDQATPTCRICHLPGGIGTGEGDGDALISPCRCAGTMQHIHTACLMKWLEVSSRKSKRPPSCELCLYQYHRHKKFKVQQWQFPQCSTRDKVLHTLFFLSLATMVAAATVTILCFKHDKGPYNTAAGGAATGGGPGQRSATTLDKINRLTHAEVVTLVCGVLFFVAFFLAMYVEVKARSTIYKLVVDFLFINQQWHIDEYDKKTDLQSVPV